jgi:hypothetical protein
MLDVRGQQPAGEDRDPRIGQPQPCITVTQLEPRMQQQQWPENSECPQRAGRVIAAQRGACEERNHPVAHREVDWQQRRDAADLYRSEQQARIRTMQEQQVDQQSEQAEAQRERATDRVPCSSLVEMHEAHQERRADGPRSCRKQRAYLQERQPAEQPRERAELAREQTRADRHVVRAGQRRQAHPPRKHGQQETEHECRQHLILHDDRVQPASRHGRLG